MPHFVMDCSKRVIELYEEEYVIEQIFLIAQATGLFDDYDIKVRLNTFETFSVGNIQEDFIHVFAHIMAGRTTKQRAYLSKCMVRKLVELFPQIPNVAMNVSEFEKSTYFNRGMMRNVNP